MAANTAGISRSGSERIIGYNQGPVVKGVAKETPVTPAEVTWDFYSVLYGVYVALTGSLPRTPCNSHAYQLKLYALLIRGSYGTALREGVTAA